MKSILIILLSISFNTKSFCQSSSDFYNQGYQKSISGDLEGAVKFYNTAIDMSPTYSKAILARGACFNILMNNEKDINAKAIYYVLCLKDFDKYISLDVTDSKGYVLRANSNMTWYASSKKIEYRDKACADWQLAKSLGDNQAQIFASKYCQK